jgi:Phage integrase family
MHEARHTAITDFLRRSGNLKLAQMLAGHADIGTTANIYAIWTRPTSRRRSGRWTRTERDAIPESFRPETRFAGMMEAAGIEPASEVAP